MSFCGAAQATAIDLVPATASAAPAASHFVPSVAVAPAPGSFVTLVRMSELPEPEVFAMMLVGLILIGYRAGRDSSEKFK
ncbi:MAG TPA: hypothetical protein VNT33_02395 [Telluria sp.]|nr:hypothetical protein [Telluria sp.]